MKNVQVIDGARNCTYDVYAVKDRDFEIIFPNNTDIEFISDLIARIGKREAMRVTNEMWRRRKDKKKVSGIHGTLFYELDFKKPFYPTKREGEMKVVL
jgi:hypothetical protein